MSLGQGMNCDVWILFPHKVCSKHLLNKYIEFLNAEEKESYYGYVNQDAAFTYLCSRVLLKSIVSSYIDIPPNDLVFSKGLYGKPMICRSLGDGRQIYFNLTHTRDMVAVAISRSNNLGVDAELIEDSMDFMEICFDNFAADECQLFDQLPNGKQKELFYKLWTLKESYLKARGEGLLLPLHYPSFSFTKEGNIKCKLDKKLDDNPSDWQFSLFHPTCDHIVSVSVNTKEKAVPINVFEVNSLEKPALKIDLDIKSSIT